MRASSRKRAATWGCERCRRWRILIATDRPIIVSRARTTSPIPPRPTTSPHSKRSPGPKGSAAPPSPRRGRTFPFRPSPGWARRPGRTPLDGKEGGEVVGELRVTGQPVGRVGGAAGIHGIEVSEDDVLHAFHSCCEVDVRKPLLIVTAFVVGGMVGWKMHGRPDTAASPSHGMVSCPTGDGRRKTVQLTIIPTKADTHGDVDLGPEDWWIEIGGKVYFATSR